MINVETRPGVMKYILTFQTNKSLEQICRDVTEINDHLIEESKMKYSKLDFKLFVLNYTDVNSYSENMTYSLKSINMNTSPLEFRDTCTEIAKRLKEDKEYTILYGMFSENSELIYFTDDSDTEIME